MTVIPGTCRILKGYGTRLDRGTPPTMQLAVGSSRLLFSRRRLYSSSAQGWNGTEPGGSRAEMSPTRTTAGCHRPVMSIRPSLLFGAGAVRLGLPSGVLGMPTVGYPSHCALSEVDSSIIPVATLSQRMLLEAGRLIVHCLLSNRMEVVGILTHAGARGSIFHKEKQRNGDVLPRR